MSSFTIYWRPTWGRFLHSNDERGDPSTAREARWKQRGRNQTYRTSRNNFGKGPEELDAKVSLASVAFVFAKLRADKQRTHF